MKVEEESGSSGHSVLNDAMMIDSGSNPPTVPVPSIRVTPPQQPLHPFLYGCHPKQLPEPTPTKRPPTTSHAVNDGLIKVSQVNEEGVIELEYESGSSPRAQEQVRLL